MHFQRIERPALEVVLHAPQKIGGLVIPAMLLYDQELSYNPTSIAFDRNYATRIRDVHERLFDKPRHNHIFVASEEESSGLIGVASLYIEVKQQFAFLNGIAVRSGLKGQGYGRQMMNNLFDIARENGCTTFGLTALPDSEGFYDALGFGITDGKRGLLPYMSIDLDSDKMSSN